METTIERTRSTSTERRFHARCSPADHSVLFPSLMPPRNCFFFHLPAFSSSPCSTPIRRRKPFILTAYSRTGYLALAQVERVHYLDLALHRSAVDRAARYNSRVLTSIKAYIRRAPSGGKPFGNVDNASFQSILLLPFPRPFLSLSVALSPLPSRHPRAVSMPRWKRPVQFWKHIHTHIHAYISRKEFNWSAAAVADQTSRPSPCRAPT